MAIIGVATCQFEGFFVYLVKKKQEPRCRKQDKNSLKNTHFYPPLIFLAVAVFSSSKTKGILKHPQIPPCLRKSIADSPQSEKAT